jgi:DNA polymerase V
MIINKSIKTRNDKIAVCMIDGEFILKRLKVEKEHIF